MLVVAPQQPQTDIVALAPAATVPQEPGRAGAGPPRARGPHVQRGAAAVPQLLVSVVLPPYSIAVPPYSVVLRKRVPAAAGGSTVGRVPCRAVPYVSWDGSGGAGVLLQINLFQFLSILPRHMYKRAFHVMVVFRCTVCCQVCAAHIHGCGGAAERQVVGRHPHPAAAGGCGGCGVMRGWAAGWPGG